MRTFELEAAGEYPCPRNGAQRPVVSAARNRRPPAERTAPSRRNSSLSDRKVHSVISVRYFSAVRVLPAILLTVLTTCAVQAADVRVRPGYFDLSTPFFRARFLDPAAAEALPELGARFCRGAWMQQLTLADEEKGLLVPSTIFDHHPAFGLPSEFRGAPKIRKLDAGHDLLGKLGVGEVSRPEQNRFKDRLVSLYEWRTRVNQRDGSEPSLVFVLNAPAGAPLPHSLEVRVTANTPGSIKLVYRLVNRSATRLAADVYLHPFFTCQRSEHHWWQLPFSRPFTDEKLATPLGADAPHRLDSMPRGSLVVPADALKKDRKPWIATGNHATGSVVVLQADRPIQKIITWKHETCYAVEPFVHVGAAPGSETTWTWLVRPGRGLDRVDHAGPEGLLSVDRRNGSATGNLQLGFLPTQGWPTVHCRLTPADNAPAGWEIRQSAADASPLSPAIFQFHLPEAIAGRVRRLHCTITAGSRVLMEKTIPVPDPDPR